MCKTEATVVVVISGSSQSNNRSQTTATTAVTAGMHTAAGQQSKRHLPQSGTVQPTEEKAASIPQQLTMTPQHTPETSPPICQGCTILLAKVPVWQGCDWVQFSRGGKSVENRRKPQYPLQKMSFLSISDQIHILFLKNGAKMKNSSKKRKNHIPGALHLQG